MGGRRNFVTLGSSRWDHAGKAKEVVVVKRITSTFFFTYFLDKVKASELNVVFREFGDVDEVIVPGSRDKYGKRFDFVRFFEVSDPVLLTVKLDNNYLGEKKLFVNIPCFQRGEKGLSGGKGLKDKEESMFPVTTQKKYGPKFAFGA